MAIVWVSVTMLMLPNPAFSGNVTLKNGAQFEGKLGKITGIGESPFEGMAADKITAVMLIDDELRRNACRPHTASALATHQSR